MRIEIAVAIILIFSVAFVVPALSVPTTPVVSMIGSNNATFSSTGGSVTGWFAWGVNPKTPEWKTPNTSVSGAFSATQTGMPYYPSVIYYVKACDVTGCSPTAATWTSIPSTPIPQTTFGNTYQNITDSNFNIMYIIGDLPAPYLWEFDAQSTALGLALLAMMLFGGYFLGLWFRQRKVTLVIIMGMITLVFFMTSSYGFYWGLPAELVTLAQLMLYAGLAGLLMSLFKKG